MPGEWKSLSLDQLYDFSSGLSKPRSAFGSGYPFLAFKDIFYNSSVPAQLKELVNSTERERSKCSIKRGDVFLTRTSETMDELGMSCVALHDVPNATFNGFTKRLRPKSAGAVIPEYARYYFRSPKFRQTVTAMSTLSTRASLNNEMLSRLSITLPPPVEQAAIGYILGTFDDQIELNRKMSETLEAMARALFKSWFVDFYPVRAKMEGRDPGLPKEIADLFPSRMVESELGEIPEGWGIEPLDGIARFLNGLALQKYPPNGMRSLPVIKIAQLRAGNTYGADRASAELDSDYIVEDGDILFSWSGSLECVLWTGGQGALNQHLFKVTSTTHPRWLCYLGIHWHLADFRHIAEGKATTMGHIQRHHLSDAKIAVPPRAICNVLTRHIGPMIEAVWKRHVESRTLAALRDALLPKLISGEIRVQTAMRHVEDAIA
jgi:type I restriction enzyme S subunit